MREDKNPHRAVNPRGILHRWNGSIWISSREKGQSEQKMFYTTIREGYGSHRLSSFLNDQGLRTHNGSKFQSMTINRILRNKLYCCYFISKEAISPHIEELQIIDQDVFDQAQTIIDQRMSRYQEERTISLNTVGKTFLSGNIFCGHCGSRIITTKYCDSYTRKDGSEYRVKKDKYVCCHKAHNTKSCDGQTGYIASRVDMAIVEMLHRYFDSLKEVPQDKAVERKYAAQIEVCNASHKKLVIDKEKLEKRLQALNEEIAKSIVGESSFSPAQLSESIKTTQTQLCGVTEQLNKTTDELANKKQAMSKIDYYYNQFLSWADEFESASSEERKMIAGHLISRVKVFRGYKIAVEFDINYQQFYV